MGSVVATRGKIKVFAGNGCPQLASSICEALGVPVGQATVGRFSDGEVNIDIMESVRGCDVFVIQSTGAPANDHLMELLVMIDALKRASAANITAVIPYYGYARQDRKALPRAPISARLVADLLSAAGVNRVLSMEFHAGQIQGFFDAPVDHLYAMPVMRSFLADHYRQFGVEDPSEQLVVVSPDAGGVEKARAYARRLGASLAIIDKRRERANQSKVMNLVGDVEGRHALLVDDMIDTAGTLCHAAEAVKAHGALSVRAAATHAVLSGPAKDRIMASVIEEVVVTDTIPHNNLDSECPKVTVLSVARLFAEAISRVNSSRSISNLFE
ncbi:MAG: ribose-phosphate pyrophosphokinase [Myxococcota bacterium]|nr:ribose-phosphate pyrophosphokinase [Myxococcota bacterium]